MSGQSSSFFEFVTNTFIQNNQNAITVMLVDKNTKQAFRTSNRPLFFPFKVITTDNNQRACLLSVSNRLYWIEYNSFIRNSWVFARLFLKHIVITQSINSMQSVVHLEFQFGTKTKSHIAHCYSIQKSTGSTSDFSERFYSYTDEKFHSNSDFVCSKITVWKQEKFNKAKKQAMRLQQNSAFLFKPSVKRVNQN
jgi:hypothetical protein